MKQHTNNCLKVIFIIVKSPLALSLRGKLELSIIAPPDLVYLPSNTTTMIMHELASKLVQWLKFYNELTHVRSFKSVRLLENFVKRGYKRLNERPCAAIRDVRLFEVVRYTLITSL